MNIVDEVDSKPSAVEMAKITLADKSRGNSVSKQLTAEQLELYNILTTGRYALSSDDKLVERVLTIHFELKGYAGHSYEDLLPEVKEKLDQHYSGIQRKPLIDEISTRMPRVEEDNDATHLHGESTLEDAMHYAQAETTGACPPVVVAKKSAPVGNRTFHAVAGRAACFTPGKGRLTL